MGKKHKILIVDDSAANVYSLKKTLQKSDYEFLEAHTGESALAAIQELDPDIVLLDVRLPGIDGFQICEKIRLFNKHVPIVFVTANLKEFVDQVHGFEKGGDDYVIQPYDPKELSIKVKALLRNKRLYDELLEEVRDLDRMKTELLGHNEQLKEVNSRLEEKNEYLKTISVTDPLTSLYNRKYFHQRIEKEISAVQRYKHPASVALVDIAGFSKINEELGGPQGDVILKEMANLLINSIRVSDLAIRFDGGRFAIIFTHTSEENAMVKSNMIQASVQTYPFPVYEDLIPAEKQTRYETVTVSVRIVVTGIDHVWIKSAADIIEALENTLLTCEPNRTVIARKE